MAADISTLAIEIDSSSVKTASRDLDQFGAAGNKSASVAEKTASAWRGFAGVVASLGLGLAIKEVVQIADKMSLLDARLKLATGSALEFAAAQSEIYKIAQQNNAGIEETTQLYVKLSKPIKDLGGSTKEVAGITDAFAKAIRLGGASAQEAASAIMQFGQAMGKGKLDGGEFIAIAEASPRAMQAFADGMGVPIGKLKDMGAAGQLTADVIGNALLKSLDKLTQEAASMPDTVGGAFTRLANDAKLAIAELNKSSGATLGIAEGIEAVRSVIPSIKSELSGVVSSISQFLERNKETIKETISSAVSLGKDLWEVAKAAGAIVGFFAESVGQTGVLKTAIDAIRTAVAAVTDGVTFLGGVFATIGSLIFKTVTAPLQVALTVAANIAGVFDSALASKIKALNSEIKEFAGAGAVYGDQVAENFLNGQTALGKLNAELENSKVKTDAAKTSVESLGKASATSFAKLKSTLTDSGKATKLTEEPAYKEAMRYAQLRQELRIKENEQIADFYRDQQELQIKEVAKLRAAADSINDRAQAQENANKVFGKGRAALEELTLAQLEQNKATVMASDVVLPGVVDAIEQQIQAQKRLISATSTGEMLEAEKKRMDDMKEEWKKTTESINNSLTDALLRGFESGKGFAENLRDTLKNMFKTLVLRPVISAVVNPVSQGISSLFSGGGAAGGGVGGASGGLLGGLGALGNLGGLGGLIGGGLGSLTAGFQGASLAAGLAGPTTAGAGGLMGIGASLGASPFAGAISALGTAMPYIGAAVMLSQVFKTKKTPHLGSAVNASGGMATTDMTDYLAGNYNAETDSALRYLTLGSTGSLNKLSGMFGGGQFSANAKFASDNKDPSAADATIFMGGKEVSALGGEGYKLYAAGSEEAFKAFTKDFEGLTLQAIKSMEKLPVYVKAEFDKLGEGATIEGIASLVDQIGVFRSQLDTMRMAIGSLGSTTDEALSSIIANTGGIQQFSAAIDTYYNNFFTQAERTTFATQQLSEQFARLGVEMPQTRKDFRDLVESTATTTEEGQKLYSALLGLSGAFASVVPEAEEAKNAIANIATGAVEAAKQAIESAYTPLSSSYGTTVQNGVSFTTGNISDILRSAASGATDSLGRVTDAINDASGAWKSAADSIDAEIRRIRGEVAGTGPEGQAKALTNFATLTARARAGDVNAASMLPKASQDYLSLAAGNASSASELRRAQSTTLASLIQTQKTLGLSSSIGLSSPSVPAMHGTPSSSAGSLDALIAEVKALKLAMEIAQAASNVNTKKTADILVRVTEGGDAMLTRAAP